MCVCFLVRLCYYFFFFKQKTAYEMRISDWSSDVCSSDLDHLCRRVARLIQAIGILGGFRKKAVTWRIGTAHRSIERLLVDLEGLHQVAGSAATAVVLDGRAGGKRRRLENRGHLGIADHEDVVDGQARRAVDADV